MTVFDIIAEGFEIDLARLEFHFRRAPQPPGVIDNPHGLERRCLGRAVFPNAERRKRRHRAGKQGRGAVIGPGRAFAHQHGSDTAEAERYRGREAGRPAAHNNGRGGFAIGVLFRH